VIVINGKRQEEPQKKGQNPGITSQNHEGGRKAGGAAVKTRTGKAMRKQKKKKDFLYTDSFGQVEGNSRKKSNREVKGEDPAGHSETGEIEVWGE